MRKLAIVVALFSALSVSAVHADDIISRFNVLDQGQFSVAGNLSGEKDTANEIDRFSNYTVNGQPAFSGKYRSYSSDISVGANVGLGYGIELYASIPYYLRDYNETKFNDGQSILSNTDGFTDATFGLKYRVFKSADCTNELLIRGSFEHHSGSEGNMQGELDYLLAFTPDVKGILAARYTKVQGGPSDTGYGAYLLWQTMPQIALVPFVYGGTTDAYNTYTSDKYLQGGLQIRYTPTKGWNITPEISVENSDERYTDYYANNHGGQHIVIGSITVQKVF